ncbi:MAG TPA: hypothetical protein VFT74_16455, partial [Isosphaeraceae bacterium]|nr:hypothetical protein [Isosphaeraceae bacterium]
MSLTDDTRSGRLHQALAEYYHSFGSGTSADRSAFLRAHPDLAPDLEAFFLEQDALAALLSPSPGPNDPPIFFGDYELMQEMARGGMGVIFEARQKSLNRRVALKMIMAGALATDNDRRRFAFEAESAASLDHPHIVPIFEVGSFHGLSYYTMKLLPSGSL